MLICNIPGQSNGETNCVQFSTINLQNKNHYDVKHNFQTDIMKDDHDDALSHNDTMAKINYGSSINSNSK